MGTKGKIRGAAAARHWFALAEETLQTHRHRLDRINVYPVADSDTGGNMLATIRSSRTAVEQTSGDDLGQLLAAAGEQAMGAAYGNSGTLLAVLIRGFAEPLEGLDRLTVSALSRGFDRASLRGWSALSNPVDGTMLSVLDAARDEAARCAAAAEQPESRVALEAAMDPVLRAARAALVQTERQLDELSRAGVVDSGGLGLLMVLSALAATVRGTAVEQSIFEGLAGWDLEPGQHSRASASSSSGAPAELMDGVELMCTVRLNPLGAASLRHQLDELGESVIITPIGADPDPEGALRWRIHVHTADPEATLAAVQQAGPLESSTSTPLSGGREDGAGR